MDIDATIEAIALLRDLTAWCACTPVGQTIRTRAYLRLERELQAYLLGKE